MYLGDGMSTANLLASGDMQQLLDGLTAKRIAVSSYGIGPRVDVQLLGVLANHTGGLLVIDADDPEDKNFKDFQNEVEKLKKVNEQPNPNVVKILSSGITETGSLPFIEMEFIEGPDLEELLQPPHAPVFTIKETIKVAEQLSHALAHCHKLDIKHGDIKSNNVKFNLHTGNYVLLDFGLAKLMERRFKLILIETVAMEIRHHRRYRLAPERGRYAVNTESSGMFVLAFARE